MGTPRVYVVGVGMTKVNIILHKFIIRKFNNCGHFDKI